jgi:hypothetical protein
LICSSILERSTEDMGFESVSLRLEGGHGPVRYRCRQWEEQEGGEGEKGGTHDDEVDERERGVAMSELAVL